MLPDDVEVGPVGVAEVDRRVGGAPRLVDGGHGQAHRLAHVDDVGQLPAQLLHPVAQLEPLAEHPLLDRPFDDRSQRVEEDQDHEAGHQRVEEEHARIGRRHPRHQQAVDGRQDQHQRRQHDHLAQHLVDVEEPVAEERLRDEVHVDDGDDVAERVEHRPEERHQVGPHERDGGDATQAHVEERRLLPRRQRATVLAEDADHRRVQADVAVRREQALEDPRLVQPQLAEADAVADDDHPADADAGQRARGHLHARLPLVGEEGPEEARGEDGQRHRAEQRQEVGPLGVERQLEEHRDVPHAQHEAQRGEAAIGWLPAVAQEHRRADREGHDGRQERREGLDVHALLAHSLRYSR
jgi:hypothetical protein